MNVDVTKPKKCPTCNDVQDLFVRDDDGKEECLDCRLKREQEMKRG